MRKQSAPFLICWVVNYCMVKCNKNKSSHWYPSSYRPNGEPEVFCFLRVHRDALPTAGILIKKSITKRVQAIQVSKKIPTHVAMTFYGGSAPKTMHHKCLIPLLYYSIVCTVLSLFNSSLILRARHSFILCHFGFLRVTLTVIIRVLSPGFVRNTSFARS
jgi:hypothetical protein